MLGARCGPRLGAAIMGDWEGGLLMGDAGLLGGAAVGCHIRAANTAAGTSPQSNASPRVPARRLALPRPAQGKAWAANRRARPPRRQALTGASTLDGTNPAAPPPGAAALPQAAPHGRAPRPKAAAPHRRWRRLIERRKNINLRRDLLKRQHILGRRSAAPGSRTWPCCTPATPPGTALLTGQGLAMEERVAILVPFHGQYSPQDPHHGAARGSMAADKWFPIGGVSPPA